MSARALRRRAARARAREVRVARRYELELERELARAERGDPWASSVVDALRVLATEPRFSVPRAPAVRALRVARDGRRYFGGVDLVAARAIAAGLRRWRQA